MAKVWKKDDGTGLDPMIEKYEAGTDVHYDGQLFGYELMATAAHAKMLEKINILTADELSKVLKEIARLLNNSPKLYFGPWIELKVEDEDIHSKVENLLTESLGDIGKKIHTGRSRNDQVLVVTRLFEKHTLMSIAKDYQKFLLQLCEFAKKEGHKVLPGYTHTKQAMLMTVGMWIGGFIESGIQNLKFLEYLYSMVDQNPLGTASGFGVPIPLDRQMTTELLGFSKILENPMYAQNSRGKMESLLVDGYWTIMHDFSRMSRDLLMFNMDEFLFVETNDKITTGSSIMPQKKNFDVLELVRARANLMLSYSNTLKTLTTGLISGYHRDLQETKEPFMKASGLISDTLKVMKVVFENIEFNEEAAIASLTPGIFATDIAFKAVAGGMPFRDAYKKAAKEIENIEVNEETIRRSIDERVSPGAPSTYKPERFDDFKEEIMSEYDSRTDIEKKIVDEDEETEKKSHWKKREDEFFERMMNIWK